MVLGCMGRQLILELREFGVDEGAAGEVVDHQGWRRVGVNARRGDA